eukprot:6822667-Karenia_brevis.AAC.1
MESRRRWLPKSIETCSNRSKRVTQLALLIWCLLPDSISSDQQCLIEGIPIPQRPIFVAKQHDDGHNFKAKQHVDIQKKITCHLHGGIQILPKYLTGKTVILNVEASITNTESTPHGQQRLNLVRRQLEVGNA